MSPPSTNQLNAQVRVSALITDDSSITNATVVLGSIESMMQRNLSTGLFESVISGPSVSARYPVVITATDDTNNSVSRSSSFLLDLNPPEITILTPISLGAHTTNRINLTFYTNEQSELSYRVDSGPVFPLNATTGFQVITIPLTLLGGNHSISIQARDIFNNTITKTVQFSIEFANIEVKDLILPIFERPTSPVFATAAVRNTLIAQEDNVEVELLINGNLSTSQFINISGETSVQVSFPLALYV